MIRLVLAVGVVVVMFAPVGAKARAAEPSTLRIAVAPFEERGDGPPVDAQVASDAATLLAGRLAERPVGLVVAPGELELPASANPEAREVRRWAKKAEVDAVVVGSTSNSDSGVEVSIDIRSGHSGASLGRHRVPAARGVALERGLDGLADSILVSLGYEPESALPSVAMASPDAGSESSGVSLKTDLVGGFSSDDPLSIKSDELEVLSSDSGRELVFSHNVRVRQGDITLRSDRLEAFYEDGSSQPDRLVASGSVRVIQGDRRAVCETATYSREDDSVICSGRAELIQGCDRVRGEEIHFDLGDDRVRVSGAASVVIHPEDPDKSSKCAGGID